MLLCFCANEALVAKADSGGGAFVLAQLVAEDCHLTSRPDCDPAAQMPRRQTTR